MAEAVAITVVSVIVVQVILVVVTVAMVEVVMDASTQHRAQPFLGTKRFRQPSSNRCSLRRRSLTLLASQCGLRVGAFA